MGQEATIALPVETQLYATDVARLASRLGLGPENWTREPAMAPQVNLRVSLDKVSGFRDMVRQLVIDGKPLTFRENDDGFFSLDFGHPNLRSNENSGTSLCGQA